MAHADDAIVIDVARAPYKYVAVVDGRSVKFGRISARDPDNDYPHHRDPERMLRYLRRHGGIHVPEGDSDDSRLGIERRAAAVTRSDKENWADPHTAGFWSRWFLWSSTSLSGALAHVRRLARRDNILVTREARRRFSNRQ